MRGIASEQAFLDDLIADRGITFHSARIARLRADRFKPIDDREPPFGIESGGGRVLRLSPNHFGPDSADWFCDALRRFGPDVLYSHPGHVEALATHVVRHGIELSVPVVVTTSESLSSAGRALIASAFGADVIDYYGQAERVVFASGVADGAYFFNPVYGRVELIPVQFDSAPAGLRAFDIVGTGYWNDAMPLVRYRTDDVALVPQEYGERELEDVALGLLPVHSIQGRGKTHLVSPRGEILEGLVTFGDGVDGLVRMQVVQEAIDSVRILVAADPRSGGPDTDRIVSNARRWVPDDMLVSVEEVETFETLPSGKSPFLIRRCVDPWDSVDDSPVRRGDRSGVEWFELSTVPPSNVSVGDLDRLRQWAELRLMRPDVELGRSGAVCPYVSQSVSRGMLWSGWFCDQDVTIESMTSAVDDMYDLYQSFVRSDGRARDLRAIMTVFPSADPALVDKVHEAMKPRFVERGLMLGQFYPGCDVPGLWNPEFRPLDAPVPMLVVRTMVATDLPFLVTRADWVDRYLNRFAPDLPRSVRDSIATKLTTPTVATS